MSETTLAYLAAAVVLLALIAYVILAGADFGGGVWDLLATGPRRGQQRAAIAHAMGPVWEANHVWLIFIIVMLFTCFPRGFAALATALFVPFHLALLGIMLRGAAFVFRGYGQRAIASRTDGQRETVWGTVFGVASLLSPFILGAVFGTVTAGIIRVGPSGDVSFDSDRHLPWINVYSVFCGLLAISTCAYLAAVYLVVETGDDLREDFRMRAIIAGTSTALLAAAVFLLTRSYATWFFTRLTSPIAWPVLAAGGVCFGASAWAVFARRYKLSRIFAAAEIIMLLLGWGVAYQPYLIWPDVTLVGSLGPPATVRFLLATLPLGALLLAPSLWLLFRVFKSSQQRADH